MSKLVLKPRACRHTCSAAATPPATGGQARLDRGSHQDGRFLSTVMLVHAVTFSQSSVSRHDFSCLCNKMFNGFRLEQSVSCGAPSMPFRSTDTAMSCLIKLYSNCKCKSIQVWTETKTRNIDLLQPDSFYTI